MPGLEPTEMIWLGFGFVLSEIGGGGRGGGSRKAGGGPHALRKGSPPPQRDSLGGDVHLLQLAVRFCRLQPLLQTNGGGEPQKNKGGGGEIKHTCESPPPLLPTCWM